MHSANSIPYTSNMPTPTGRESNDPILEDEDIHLCRSRQAESLPALRRPGRQCLEGDEVIVFKDLDLFTGLADNNVLGCQRMNGQGICDDGDVFVGGIADIDPPDGV